MNEKVKDIIEWGYCIIIALVLALLFRYFIGTPTIVQQRSMFPTLQENQRLITFEAPSSEYKAKWDVDQSNPIATYENEPKGLLKKFVYYSLEITKKSYIKRVIGLPGEHVKIENGKVYINGNELEEDYLSSDVVTESDVFYDFIVPEGYIFAMGDNRTKSTDCREIGCIPFNKLEGIVCFRFWPMNVFGKI